jgi:CheY-like chemotaxis protein
MAHKLLLADDSVTIQRVIELTFADEDVQVVAVGDGKQAIERVPVERPDIVLADVGMPERDGYEVAAFIKSSPQFAHIPVLLLTGAFEPIDETRAKSAGCDGVLVKPFEPQMVINRVKELLAGRRTAGSWGTAPAASPALPAEIGASRPAPPPAPSPGSGLDGLDEYFDRLDAAFSSLGAPAASSAPKPTVAEAPPPQPVAAAPVAAPAPPPRPPAPAPVTPPAPQKDYFAHWDPDLTAPETPRVEPAPKRPVEAPPPPPPLQVQRPAPIPVPPAAPQRPLAVSPPAPSAPAASAPAAAPPPTLSEAFAALLAAEQSAPIAPSAAGPAAQPVAAQITDSMVDDIVRRVIERMGDETVRRSVVETAERMVREEIERIKKLGS